MSKDLLKGSLTPEQLAEVTFEDVAAATHKIGVMLATHVEEIAEGKRGRAESKEQFEKAAMDIGKMQEALKALRQTPVVTDMQGEYAARKGGIFKRKAPLLPYEELISMSPESSVVRGEDQELLRDLQDAHDACTFKFHCEGYVHDIVNKPGNLATVMERTYKGRDFQRYVDLVKYTGYADKDYGKADEIIHPGSSGIANPLTMSLVSGRVIDLVRINLNVANQFQQFPMQNFDQKVPVNRGDGIGLRGGAGVLDPPPKDHITSSVPPSDYLGSISFGTADLVSEDVLAFLWWNDRAVSDTVIAMVPYLRQQIAFMHARAIDRSTMSGDEAGRAAGSHMDDHASAFNANDARSLWNGLRKIGALNHTDNAGAQLDADDVRAMLKRMGVFGQNKGNLRLWMNLGPIYDLMTDPDVTTIDKWGPDAPIKTGALAMIWGVPILPTEWIPTDLDGTTGFSTAIGTQTAAVCANVERFMLGVHGTTTIESTRIAPMLSTIIQAAGKFDFVPLEVIDGNGQFAAGQVSPLDILIDLPS